MATIKTALLQLNSTSDITENITTVEQMVADASAKGAQLVATPENSFLMEASGQDHLRYSHATHPAVEASVRMAKKNKVWLLIGSIHVTPEGEKRSHNRSLLIDPNGHIAAHYDKIHLFDVDVPGDRSYRESDRILPASSLVTANCLGAMLGMTICYDVRFPQLYRALAKKGANILTVPAAFTQITGEAHWHVLLRARAIENSCFVIAPAQTGIHSDGRRTFGHSLVIDPWGRVLADGGTEPGVVICDLDLNEVQKVRTRLPSLTHDREFS